MEVENPQKRSNKFLTRTYSQIYKESKNKKKKKQ